eukprot:8958063-Karenia_brevis.AAC.1
MDGKWQHKSTIGAVKRPVPRLPLAGQHGKAKLFSLTRMPILTITVLVVQMSSALYSVMGDTTNLIALVESMSAIPTDIDCTIGEASPRNMMP